MIIGLGNFSRIADIDLPFVPYVPWDLSCEDISVRIGDTRWPTLRYAVHFLGHRFRVKQFFMDWFFTGFPKALMSSFVDTYSPVEFTMDGSFHIYTGINYRGNVSASVYSHGTEIEIEGSGEISHEIFRVLVVDHLSPINGVADRIRDLQFPDRSFFAKGHPSSWYEEERIRRLHWSRSSSDQSIRVDGTVLNGSGFGILQNGGGGHGIGIFQKDSFGEVAWFEFASEDVNIEHPYYHLRKGNGFFHNLSTPGTWSILHGSGPGPVVAQENRDGVIMTLAGTPGIAANLTSNLPEIERQLVRLFSPYFRDS